MGPVADGIVALARGSDGPEAVGAALALAEFMYSVRSFLTKK